MLYKHDLTGARVRLEKVGRNRWEGRMRSDEVTDVFDYPECFLKSIMEWKYDDHCGIVLDLERGGTPADYGLYPVKNKLKKLWNCMPCRYGRNPKTGRKRSTERWIRNLRSK